MAISGWIDELEAELGLAARLRLIELAGGERRHIPTLTNLKGSSLAGDLGPELSEWLAERFGSLEIDIPTRTGSARMKSNSYLIADILDAGLENPTRSLNELARAHGVTRRWVLELRRRLLAERSGTLPPLPLFGGDQELVPRSKRHR